MKIKRHNEILELIKSREIGTQEELLDLLKNKGYDVTQATISRDIRELNLTKVNNGGRQKYAVIVKDEEFSDKYVRVLKEGFVSMLSSGNLIVLKTVVGMAMAVATAIDALEMPEIIGCIAGDDTIFIAVSENNSTMDVMNKLKKLTKEG
ncbi:arginine repressor [Catonella morbi ATCC 51271]|uniref:Arginine repressor n=1 Tax=Catonella morbi ATCC 51271 TaxID=592026 RepID=V2XNF0_9FIRM|nr:arginine repressor [Catonella morbi]ESL03679.1 arginine repressor [Catonella morbi ATCC 51271]